VLAGRACRMPNYLENNSSFSLLSDFHLKSHMNLTEMNSDLCGEKPVSNRLILGAAVY
jgi:hypothetical protein